MSTVIESTGNERKAAALDLLDARRQVYVNRGRRVLLKRLLAGETATADDVRASVELPDGIDPRCFGAVFRSLAKAGIIRSAGFVQSTRPERHASIIQAWELRDGNKAIAWMREHPDKPDPGPPDTKKAGQLALPGMELS